MKNRSLESLSLLTASNSRGVCVSGDASLLNGASLLNVTEGKGKGNSRRSRLPLFVGVLAAFALPAAAYAQPQPGQPQPGQPGQPQPGQPAPGGFGGPAPGGFGQPGQPQPGQPQPGQPQPGQPQPGQPAPGGFGDPNFNGDQPQPGQPQPGQPGFDPNNPNGQFGQPPPPSDTAKPDEWKERSDSLTAQNNLYGSTGMLHTTYAGSGAPGTFRVGFLFDWFTSKGFLCDPTAFTEAHTPLTCNKKDKEDTASRVGGYFNLSVTPFSFLEVYAMLRTYATSDDQGSPQLLQVLGDTTFGVKGFLPHKFLGPLNFGADVQLLLLNGTGDVGLKGGSTGARITALGTLDLRDLKKTSIPIKVNLNLGYKVDNSGNAVSDVEAARGAAISRIERFSLGINKVDFFQTALGVEVPFWFMQPYVEWSVDVPVNRQGYECKTASISRGDVCLGLTNLSSPNGDGAGFGYIPSRFSIGTKVTPFKSGAFRGLAGHLAFDIGTSGTSEFIEEVAPTPPWTMMIGLGYAFDTKEHPIEKPVQLPPPPPVQIPIPENMVRGLVHETGKADPVPNAIVAFQGGVQPPLATGADGRFLSRNMDPGNYTFEITAPNYKPGTCAVTVQPIRQQQPPQLPVGLGGYPQPMQQPMPQGPQFTDVDCQLEALPRTGAISGTVKDLDGHAVGGAVLSFTDSAGHDQKVTADGSGNFKLEALPPGEITIKADAHDYMKHVEQGDIRANEETKRTIILNKRPKTALVKIQGNELKLGDKILFDTDSARIQGQSSALLEEIADVMEKNPDIEQVEIQGHTDSSSTPEHNQVLSDQRAAAVRDWLIKAGISGARMTAKGYGQTKPLAPNVTDANMQKNRRVQFIILKKRGGV